jgi:hypothetical protein
MMKKLDELQKQLEEYQTRYQKLLKTDKVASSRYGDEFRDMQLRVLEASIKELKEEIASLKRKD